MGPYADAFRRSIDDPDGFWAEAAAAVSWAREPTSALDDARSPFTRWFPDGELNTCFNALDRHVEGGRGEQVALVYDSPVTGSTRRLSYRVLRDETACFAGVLRGLGVGRGDRVVIYMPMVPEAVVAMLACARLGAVHSVVFGGFARHELALRIDDARPTVVVTASCGIEASRVIEYKPLLDRAIELAAPHPRRVRGAPSPAGRAVHEPARRRLARGHGGRRAGGMCGRGGHRPALHPVHVGDHGTAQGGCARQRRPRRGAGVEHGQRLRHPRR